MNSISLILATLALTACAATSVQAQTTQCSTCPNIGCDNIQVPVGFGLTCDTYGTSLTAATSSIQQSSTKCGTQLSAYYCQTFGSSCRVSGSTTQSQVDAELAQACRDAYTCVFTDTASVAGQAVGISVVDLVKDACSAYTNTGGSVAEPTGVDTSASDATTGAAATTAAAQDQSGSEESSTGAASTPVVVSTPIGGASGATVASSTATAKTTPSTTASASTPVSTTPTTTSSRASSTGGFNIGSLGDLINQYANANGAQSTQALQAAALATVGAAAVAVHLLF